MSSEIKVDTISEKTSANGVTIDGVNLKDSVVKTDTISEKTSAAGVTIDGSLIKDGNVAGIMAEADQWCITADVSSSGVLTANWSRVSGTLLTYKGTGMTESSGIFSFPSTGYWLIMVQAYLSSPTSGVGSAQLNTVSTNDDFTSEDDIGVNRIYQSSNNNYTTTFSQSIIDVTNVSNDKIKFDLTVSGDGQIEGNINNTNSSRFCFYKLGET